MISAIIRCRNEEKWIGHAIQSVLDFVEDPEIIVIDNESQDESLDVVRMFETFSDVKSLRIQDYSPGRALNLGVSKCKHDYILILSAHCVITKFRENIVEKLEECVCIFGNQIPIYRGKKILKRYVWSNFSGDGCENMWAKQEGRFFLHNAFAVYKKEVLVEHQFDEHLYGKEDRYWVNAVIKKGFKSLYAPSLECSHHWTPEGATWKGIG